MAKAKAKKACAKKECAKLEMVVVGSKVKAYIKSLDAKTAGDVLEGLNCKVHCLISSAVARAKANKRTTVRAADL